MSFSVVLVVYFPIKGTTFDGVELHKHFRNFSESVENVLRLFVGYLLDPLEVLKKDERTVKVDSTMRGHQCQAMEIRLSGRKYFHFFRVDDGLHAVESLGGNVAMSVGIADFDDFVAAALCFFDEIL